MDQINFTNIAISDELKRGISEMGYDTATSIQSQSIPLILEGYDVIGRSQTGSGKTAAFGLPAIEIIDMAVSPKIVQVLILCPTRELAFQACNEIRKFSKYKNGINVVPVYGGEPIDRQIARLRQGCQIVVGTPGRIMDHMRRKTLKLANVKMVVLDEADEMLNMGFVEDIETILTDVPQERQTILFSATMTPAVLKITKKFLSDPKMIEIKQSQMTVSTIEQFYFDVPKGKKNESLFNLLEYYKPSSSIIFCNTKKMVDELLEELQSHGYQAQGLHGDMRQSSRMQVMRQFKEEKFNILVATDVAARGIDVNDVKIVFNYDIPQEDEYYVHRIGRTGRAGKSGLAFTLVQGAKQRSQLMDIMRYTKSNIVLKALPTAAEIKSHKIDELSNELLAFMEENSFSEHASTVEKLTLDKYTASDIAAALFAMFTKQNSSNVDDSVVSEEKHPIEVFHRKDNSTPKRNSVRNNQKAKGTTAKVDYEDENMTKVKISIGRKDKIGPKHILGAVAGGTGLPGKLFGAINIQNTFSTIDVPKEFKKLVIKSINNTKINGKIVTVD